MLGPERFAGYCLDQCVAETLLFIATAVRGGFPLALEVPADVPVRLWAEALNACEESRVHRFLGSRLPGSRRYLRALFDTNGDLDAKDFRGGELHAFLVAAASWDRHDVEPFLSGFPQAAEACEASEDARVCDTCTLPPSGLAPQASLERRFKSIIGTGLKVPESVVPLEAEILCAAGEAMKIFRRQIWPVCRSLADEDIVAIAEALAQDRRLGEAAAAASAPWDEARLTLEALRRMRDARIRGGDGTADVEIEPRLHVPRGAINRSLPHNRVSRMRWSRLGSTRRVRMSSR